MPRSITVLAFGLFLIAQADSSGQVISYEQTNGPTGDATARFTIGEPAVEAGGGHILGQSTPLADGSEFFLFSQSTLPDDSLAQMADRPSTYSFSGLRLFDGDGQPVPSVLGDTARAYFTVDGVPQLMSDPFGLGLSFEALPNDPTIMAASLPLSGASGAPGPFTGSQTGPTDWTYTAATEFVGGMSWMGSTPGSATATTFGSADIGVFDIVGLSEVKNDINGIHTGIDLRPTHPPAGIVFRDDFEDGNARDGSPVSWSPVPRAAGSFDVIDGDYVLTRPSDQEEMYSVVDAHALTDISIRTQGRLIGSDAWWMGLFARTDLADYTTYAALLKNNANLEIWRFGPSSWTMDSANVGIDPREQEVLLRFDVIGNELSAWAWLEGDPMPAQPQVTAINSDFAAGRVGVAADLGFQLSDADAIFRYVEVFDGMWMTYDCNSDGMLNVRDLNCSSSDRLVQALNAVNLIQGDANGDGRVDFDDFVVLSNNFGSIGTYTDGDFDLSGIVDFDDFVLLANSFSETAPSAASVPEPSGGILMAIGIAGTLLRRHGALVARCRTY